LYQFVCLILCAVILGRPTRFLFGYQHSRGVRILKGLITTYSGRIVGFLTLRIEPVKNEVIHWLSAEDMLLEDPFERCGIDLMVPDTIRVDDQNRPFRTDAQAICQGALDALWVA
jgi:hypothetical protein